MKTPNCITDIPIQNRIAAAPWHVVGLKNDGTVMVTRFAGTGFFYSNQCNVGTWRDIVAISAGLYHTAGLKSDGTVVCTYKNVSYAEISQWTDIVAISSGMRGLIGLRRDGSVVAVGSWDSYDPHELSGWSDIVAISQGDYFTVGLRNDGTLVYAGKHDSYPLDDILSWTNIVAVSSGCYHTVGLRRDGTVVAAGANCYEQCDVGEWQNIIAVAAGADHTVGLCSDGSVKVTGYGRFPRYTNCNRSSHFHSFPIESYDVSAWRNIVAISAAHDFTVGLRDDGTVLSVNAPGAIRGSLIGWNVFENTGGLQLEDGMLPYSTPKTPYGVCSD